jgi:transposase-like protein
MDDMQITETRVITCKHCGSEAIVKFGTYKGVQRYYCKVCRRKFKDDKGAFHGKVPSEYISSAVNMYYTGMSINEIRSHLKQEHSYYPSKSVVWGWVEKYTGLASKQFKDYHPQVGDVWVADETMLDVDGQHKLWFYDIIDTKTRYLLASRIAISRTTGDSQLLMNKAMKVAGKEPKTVITDKAPVYMDVWYGKKGEHVTGSPFKGKDTGESTSQIERFHGTLKDRTKVIRSFRDFETLKQFTDGWLIYYNYFKPHESLKGKTPAEQAHVQYSIKNWADLTRLPVTKKDEISSHKTPKAITSKAKTDLTNAFKRHRPPRISQSVPRLTSSVGRLE